MDEGMVAVVAEALRVGAFDSWEAIARAALAAIEAEQQRRWEIQENATMMANEEAF